MHLFTNNIYSRPHQKWFTTFGVPQAPGCKPLLYRMLYTTVTPR